MKKIILIFLVLAMISCEDVLVEKPKSIAVSTFYNTSMEVQSAIAAIYAPLRGAFGLMLTGIPEAMSDYGYGRASWAPLSDYQGLNTTNINRTNGLWNSLYSSIRNANIVIMNVPNGKELTANFITQSVAEAKFLRALSYFYLVRNWGGVPIRTDTNFDVLEVGRNTEAEVYSLIISDLQEAETNLPDNPPIAGRPSKWSAKTLLADVYFYRGLNSEAASKANEVIGKYSLVPVQTVDDFYKIFGVAVVNSTEEIFYMKYNRESGCGIVMNYHHPGSKLCGMGGYFSFYTKTETNLIWKNWDADDLRKGLWYKWQIGQGDDTMLSLKFIDPAAVAGGAFDLPLYRYSYILLLSAEAEVRSTGVVSAGAMEKVNMVHRRAYGYDPMTTSAVDFNVADFTTDTFIDMVIMERCYEFAHEAKRWYDLKRLGAVKLKEIILANTGKDVADSHLLWPIPYGEMQYNSLIDPATDQNPGY